MHDDHNKNADNSKKKTTIASRNDGKMRSTDGQIKFIFVAIDSKSTRQRGSYEFWVSFLFFFFNMPKKFPLSGVVSRKDHHSDSQ